MTQTKSYTQVGEYVKLNVGGSLFYTTIQTLKNAPDSMFSAMFSGRMEVKTDPEGWVLIDRCGKHFNSILNYLRDSDIPLPDNVQELQELNSEAKFYCLENLIKKIDTKVSKIQADDDDYLCSKATIIIVKDSKMAKSLIASTSKPVVKLTMNRYNNVFSYTSNSHDNLLRNVECLEKYALMFADTIRFIKDVSEKFENNQICEWSFHYRNFKLRSIDCMAIHYSTEKRLIKVEFHESRIHEEMLMLISVATRDLSDTELFEMSKRGSGNGGSTGSGQNATPCIAGNITTAQINSERDDADTETRFGVLMSFTLCLLDIETKECLINRSLKALHRKCELKGIRQRVPYRRNRFYKPIINKIKLKEYTPINYSGFVNLN